MAEPKARELTDRELLSILRQKINEATGRRRSKVTKEQRDNLEMYLGEPLGNEMEGRSQVVSRDVMDTVEWIMPTLMAMFHGTENPVEFTPTGIEDEQFADQATDYINYVYNNDSSQPGFMITYTWLKDALIQKLGVIKMYVETETKTERSSYSGLTIDQAAMLMQQDGVEVAGGQIVEVMAPDGFIDELVDLTLIREVEEKRICVDNLTPEEFIIERRARSLDDAKFMAHRTDKTRTELLQEGYDADVVWSLPSYTQKYEGADDENTRYDQENYNDELPEGADRATDRINITESILYVDYDGDGIAERRRIISAGNEEKILLNEQFDDPLFVMFSPIPTPHTVWGMSVADLVRDLQEIKTALWRGMLDGLYLSLDPDKILVPELVGEYMEDHFQNKVPGLAVRTAKPGGVEYQDRPWGGAKAFPMMEYLDRILEGRTGVSQQSQGINKDLLQNTTLGAYNIASTNAQKRVEMIARIFAETAMKPLFKGLLQLSSKYQDRERVIRLRNEWAPVDPRAWNTDMDVSINVGLGVGNKDQQMAYLQVVLREQKEALMSGPEGRRLVTVDHIYKTYEQLTKAAGFPSAEPFFRDPSSQEAMQEAAQAQQAPNPMAMMAQLEMMKFALDRQEMLMKDDRERDKFEAELQLKATEMQAKYGAQIDIALIRALMERDRQAMRQRADLARQPMPPAGPAPGGLAVVR